jgi:aspartyl protease family protein
MRVLWRYSSPIWAILPTGASHPAFATDVNVVGLFKGKAVVVINGGRPQVLSVDEKSASGVRLIAADSQAATLEIDGRRRTLAMGQSAAAPPSASSTNPTATITADRQGHFVTLGSVNGSSTQFLVDTGASYVSFSVADAKRMGIPYLQGQRGLSATANGTVTIYRVMLNTVKVGGITLNQVEAAIHESDMPMALLGMSFLNRVEMRRDGTAMTLVKRY